MIIGITGGIGSGKSYIAKALEERGFVRYDTDKEAKRLITTDPSLKAALITLLGQKTYINGMYNTQYVASRIFGNPQLLQQINALVHPVVKKDILNAGCTMHNAQCTMLVESAILFESGLDSICDTIIVVTAPKDIRLKRAMQRDKTTEEQIRARVRTQMSDKELAEKADIVINNDGQTSIDDICQSIMQIL